MSALSVLGPLAGSPGPRKGSHVQGVNIKLNMDVHTATRETGMNCTSTNKENKNKTFVKTLKNKNTNGLQYINGSHVKIFT